MEEMRSLAGTVGKAWESSPHLYQRHDAVRKELSRLRKTLAKDTRETARKEYFTMSLCSKSTGRSNNFSVNLMLGTVMPMALMMKTGNFPSLNTSFPSERGWWKTSTVLKRSALMRISYLHDVSRLLKTWFRSRSSASRVGGATESIGMLMITMMITMMIKLRSWKRPYLLKRNL